MPEKCGCSLLRADSKSVEWPCVVTSASNANLLNNGTVDFNVWNGNNKHICDIVQLKYYIFCFLMAWKHQRTSKTQFLKSAQNVRFMHSASCCEVIQRQIHSNLRYFNQVREYSNLIPIMIGIVPRGMVSMPFSMKMMKLITTRMIIVNDNVAQNELPKSHRGQWFQTNRVNQNESATGQMNLRDTSQE